MKKFQDDLLKSVKQMRQGKAARINQVELSPAAEARAKMGLSQQAFASLLGVSVRTLQDWEQGPISSLTSGATGHNNLFEYD